MAQAMFPSGEEERMRYSAYIEMPKGYISGIMILKKVKRKKGKKVKGGEVRGCFFNEFGLTAMDFTYYPDKRKVKLGSVINMLDKWYIRRVIRKDLTHLMSRLEEGDSCYVNERQRITYRVEVMSDK